jgi:hypothetical protein
MECTPFDNAVTIMDVKEMARLGGIARAKSMTAEARRESAMKAAKAAAVVHRKKAKKRKTAQSGK